MAVAPASVYYSRYFIQETLLVTFTLALFICAQRWWQTGLTRWAIAAGACIGLMQATKASAPLFLAAGLVAVIVTLRARPVTRRPRRDIIAALTAALAVAALFYSSFGTHVSGLRDAISTYTAVSTRAATGSGHEKPWWYYLGFFGWHRDGGLLWQQLAFSTLAFCGVLVAFATPQKILRCAALYTFIIVGALSLAPYKTPWHTVHLVPGFAFLAAGALAALPLRLFAFATAGIVLALQSKQTQLAAFLRPADARNPYAYVHSSPDVLKIRALAEAALARTPAGPIRIISEEYWPIPWYLRALPPTAVGYWPTPPAISDGALIIASSTQAVALRPLLRARYHESYLGLRPGFLLVVFTPITATP
jgi:predicted membrane-bound mannosyltransferase